MCHSLYPLTRQCNRNECKVAATFMSVLYLRCARFHRRMETCKMQTTTKTVRTVVDQRYSVAMLPCCVYGICIDFMAIVNKSSSLNWSLGAPLHQLQVHTWPSLHWTFDILLLFYLRKCLSTYMHDIFHQSFHHFSLLVVSPFSRTEIRTTFTVVSNNFVCNQKCCPEIQLDGGDYICWCVKINLYFIISFPNIVFVWPESPSDLVPTSCNIIRRTF